MPLMQMARSFVMKPASMVSTQTASSASANTRSSAFLSSSARCSSPRDQAKIEADGIKLWVYEVALWWPHCFYMKMKSSLCVHHLCILLIKIGEVSVFLTDGVGGRLLALLVHTIMPRDGAMGCLGFYCTPVRTHEHTGHHTQWPIA